ncbi:hypothetical protein JY97_14520 [Alkalispirochaeta odontotermitis]|nr:hypothetical protein JY97_14520 [Alkalispirochaeta odontotermitis]
MIELHRVSKETNVHVILDMDEPGKSSIKTELAFLNHMLTAMSFHGRFRLNLVATGDIDVDPHHLIEDTGLVIGSAFEQVRLKSDGIKRYGSALIPMDDALSEVVVDAGGRPYLCWNVNWAQPRAGNLDLSLLRDFFWGLATGGKMNLHLSVRYSENGHHAAEALFKAVGFAIREAYKPSQGGTARMSTKGII